MENIEIKAVTQGRGRICSELLRSVPLCFGDDAAVRQCVAEVETMSTFAAYDGEKALGFLSLNRRNAGTAEVHAMAVLPAFHRKGIGRSLIGTAEKYLKEFNYEFLSIRTVPPSRPGKEHEQARKFLQAVGFRAVAEYKMVSGDANPFLLMIKVL